MRPNSAGHHPPRRRTADASARASRRQVRVPASRPKPPPRTRCSRRPPWRASASAPSRRSVRGPRWRLICPTMLRQIRTPDSGGRCRIRVPDSGGRRCRIRLSTTTPLPRSRRTTRTTCRRCPSPPRLGRSCRRTPSSPPWFCTRARWRRRRRGSRLLLRLRPDRWPMKPRRRAAQSGPWQRPRQRAAQ
ncbi:hypothetical protein BRADI_2g17371v3 [Brachypodium distachyon]|uniref:Uncharacterized protein n=1 Tax=Brachypodium distachyon TaxID=15368 RepID=A0A2K2D917_BRADI|nr:hypothetical protein BRADI_2g17371v3 [Brachypodium distachyon]